MAYDEPARWGVPAHVTVLFPFVPPDAIGDEVRARVAEVVATVPRFEVTFARTDWFDTDVLWLAPDPSEPFGALTDAVWQAFPDRPPFEGRHADVVPHLTIGHAAAAGLDALRRAEAEVRQHLPVRSRVTEVELWCGTDAPGGWRREVGFALG
jgi:2'-5' RNA ligase